MTTTECRWLQLNVALSRRDGDALGRARAVFAALTPQLAARRVAGDLDAFFFMRKPPDLRLRFGGPDPRAAMARELTRTLDGLREQGIVERFFVSVYEPEVRLFGGPEAMALVHEHFDADTTAWLELDGLRATGRASLPPELIACAVMNELFTLLLDATETWDAWCNLATVVGEPATAGPACDRPPMPRALRTEATAGERRVLDEYRRCNERLAGGLAALRDGGRLDCGLRGMLPFVALFHLHRHGLDGSKQASIAEAMRRAWNPRGQMRGANGPGAVTSST